MRPVWSTEFQDRQGRVNPCLEKLKRKRGKKKKRKKPAALQIGEQTESG